MNYHNIMDAVFNGMANSITYRALVFPELYERGQPQPVLSNWSADDREMFCGGEFTAGYGLRVAA